MSMTPDQSNPVMKYMPYIFPVFLLFIFNNLPSALTWYYTVSNVITLILQFIIQHYIIDHDKIMARIEENRKKPRNLASVLMSIAVVYVYQEEYEEALKYYYRSDSVIQKYKIQEFYFNIAQNLGDVYDRLQVTDSSFNYFKKSKQTLPKH